MNRRHRRSSWIQAFQLQRRRLNVSQLGGEPPKHGNYTIVSYSISDYSFFTYWACDAPALSFISSVFQHSFLSSEHLIVATSFPFFPQALLCIPERPAHVRGPRNFGETCNGPVRRYLRSNGACKRVQDHQRRHLFQHSAASFFRLPTLLHQRAALAARVPHISNPDKHPYKFRNSAETCATSTSVASSSLPLAT